MTYQELLYIIKDNPSKKFYVLFMDDEQKHNNNIPADLSEYVYDSLIDIRHAILSKKRIIITHNPSYFNFDRYEAGYELYVVCHKTDTVVHIVPNMNIKSGKEIRLAHNISKMIIAGSFNPDLGISDEYFYNKLSSDSDEENIIDSSFYIS